MSYESAMQEREKKDPWVVPHVGIDLDSSHRYEGMRQSTHEAHLKLGKKAFEELQKLAVLDENNHSRAREALVNCASWLPLEVGMLMAIDVQAKTDDEKPVGAVRRQGRYTWTLAQAAKYWGVQINAGDRFQSPVLED